MTLRSIEGGRKQHGSDIRHQPYFKLCNGEGVQYCLRAIKSAPGEPSTFSDLIAGFEFEWGYEAKIVVQSFPIPDPPRDGSSIGYKMIEMKSKTKVAPGTTFYFKLEYNPLLPEDVHYHLPGSCAEGGYAIAGNIRLPGNQLAFDKGVTCEAFESALKTGVKTIQLSFGEPAAPLSVVEVTTW